MELRRAIRRPRYISDKMVEWTCGTFNENASYCVRAVLYNRIISDADAKT
ncbi:hypothetical protein PHMEG_00017728 [Phytophthora megakarya]|uniref:Uncharacterized protein n=1 Tax=Phytophthora megakarya TaxID=4795 RepID=A0A225VVK3_9STRA|nr:hypothetical protein PHMEG_00017728 [Phytophthora megakarya]